MTFDVERLLKRLGIEATKKGREWFALCPNPEHEDRSPSWRMRDEPGSSKHGYMKCWPCSFQGTAIDLVMKLLKIDDRHDAVAWIEREVPVDQKEVVGIDVKVERAPMRFHLPPEVREGPFEEWPSPPRDYLKRRGIEDWQVERWGIGYAIEGRLAGRVVIPSRLPGGRAVRYTARAFTDDPKRYLEPTSRELADQGAMFGEQHWPLLNGNEDRDLLFVVEGAINGLALEAELPGVFFAATAGSSLRPMYALKMSTWKRVCVMTDPDKAGDALAKEIEDATARCCRTSRIRLEEGFDPAKLRELRPGALRAIVMKWLRTSRSLGT